MATIPIPSNKWMQKYAYILKYDLGDSTNLVQKVEIVFKESEYIYDFRVRIYEKYGIDVSSYLIGWVMDNKL